MAKITLTVNGNITDAQSKIAIVKRDLKSIEQFKIKISVDASGVEALDKSVLKSVNAFAKLTNAQARLKEANSALAIQNEKSRQATEARLTAEARLAAQMEKTATAEEQARAANLNLSTQIERTNTAEAQRALQAERTATAEAQRIVQVERTATAEAQLAVQTERTRTAEAELQIQQERTNRSLQQGESAAGGFAASLGKMLVTRVISMAIQALVSSLREAVTTLKDVDQQLVNLRKVNPDLTVKDIEEIGDRAFSASQKYAVAVNDFLASVYEFEKAGLSDSAEAMAELATKTMLVGDTTAAIADQFLISVNAAWELKGSMDALSMAVDQADHANNNYATTLEKIADAMPIVAQTAASMNMSYEETLALLTTINSKTQETGRKTATAVRSFLIALSGQIGDFVDDVGETYDITTENIEALTDALAKYGNEAVKHAQATGEIINPMEALNSLAAAYRDGLVDEIELQNILIKVAGKMRYNSLVTIVKDLASETSTYNKILGELAGAAGTADAEVSVMLDSWNAKAQRVKTAFAGMVDAFMSTGTIKGFLDDLAHGMDDIARAINGIKDPEDLDYAKYWGAMTALTNYKKALDDTEALEKWRAANEEQLASLAALVREYEKGGTDISLRWYDLAAKIEEIIPPTSEATAAQNAINAAQERGRKLTEQLKSATQEHTAAMTSLTGATNDQADAAESAQDATDKLAASAKATSAALKDFEEYGGLTTDSMKGLTEAMVDSLDALFDETGALNKTGVAAFETASEFEHAKDAAEYLQATAQAANYANLIAQIQAAGTAAVVSTQQIAAMLQAVGMSANIADAQARGMALTAKYNGTSARSELLSYLNAQAEALKKETEEIARKAAKSGSTGSGSSSGKSSGTEKDEELEARKAEVSLEKQRLSFLEASGAADDERIAKMQDIQTALHAQAEYLRSIGASEEDIEALSTEWWTIQSKIKDIYDAQAKTELERYKNAVSFGEKELSYLEAAGASDSERIAKLRDIQAALQAQETYLRSINATEDDILDVATKRKKIEKDIADIYKEQEKAAKQAFYDYADAQKKALEKMRDAALKPLQDQLEALKAQRDAVEEQRKEQEKLLAVEEARRALENAQNQRNVRQFNADTQQWEWVADSRSIEDAKKAVIDAEKELADYHEERLYQAQKKAVEDQIAATQEAFEAQRDAWTEAAELVRSGALSIEEAMAYASQAIQNAANQISSMAFSSAEFSGTSSGGSSSETTKKSMKAADGYSSKMPDMSRNTALAGQTVRSNGMNVSYDSNGYATKATKAYDAGGVLHGLGGIKATPEDELILPSDLTKAILSPALTQNVANQIEKLGVLTGARPVAPGASVPGTSVNRIGTQNNNCNSFQVFLNGMQVPNITAGTTLGELAQTARNLSLYRS